uniref:Uncharacterized protein n=1 Tax=Cannabis sativa TaxID=3483 RepID=A0A803PUR0_CANSA
MKRGAGDVYYLQTHTNDHRIVVRLPNKKELKDDFFWATGLFPINTTKFQIIFPTDEENRDYVARSHYLKNVTPWEAEDDASRGNNFGVCGWSPSVLRAERTTLVNFRDSRYNFCIWNCVDLIFHRNCLEISQETLKRIKKIANKKRASTQLMIEPEKSPNNSTAPVVASSGEQALGSVHQVKFSGSQPELVFLEPSCPLPNFAGIKEFKARSVDLTLSVSMLFLLCVDLTLSDSEEQKTVHKAELEAVQKKAKDFKDAIQKVQAEANKKIEEAKARINMIAERSIYLAGLANPLMDLSFMGAITEEMQTFYEQTKKRRGSGC